MNFALILLILVLVTGVAWVLDKLVFMPGRRRAADAAVAEFDRQQTRVGERFADENAPQTRARLRDEKLRQPWWLEYTASFFPVILAVFVVRSFVVEPFKIPSGSMVPTLLVGDLILVNKFHYGVRLPVIDKKIISNHDVQRGDVMVFKFPEDTSQNFIKRVAGIPGDEIRYADQKLYINGKLADVQPQGAFYDADGRATRPLFIEQLGEKKHQILVEPQYGRTVTPDEFPYRDQCVYTNDSVTCKVPAGHYFMLGDNRDNSRDSRFWGFVPDRNIVGKAFMVWMSFDNPKRIGTFFD